MAIVQVEIEGQQVYIDTETGQLAQAPVNSYGGAVAYSPTSYQGVEGQTLSGNAASTIAGYPVSAYQQRPSTTGQYAPEVFNPATGQWEEGYRVPFEMGGALSMLPKSIAESMGGQPIKEPPPDSWMDTLGAAMPGLIFGGAGLMAGGGLGLSGLLGNSSPAGVTAGAGGMFGDVAGAGTAGVDWLGAAAPSAASSGLLPNIPGGSQIIQSLLGGSGEAPASGATRPPGGLAGQANIIAPSNAMLNFAQAPKSGSFVNQQSDNTSTLFSGLTPEQSRIPVPNAPINNAAPLKMAEFEDYAPIYSAHGGLMHFDNGGAVPDEAAKNPATDYVGSLKQVADTNKRIAEILAKKGSKATSSDDQIKEYLRRSQDSNARLDFLSPLSSRMMRGRPSRPEAMYSGLQRSSVTGAAPAMGYSARPVQPMQQSPSIVNMARIPFAAHGGAIHPHLASVLADRNFEINKEMIPGPEGRYYARHEQRGFAVGGPGTGQSDDIPTMLSDGEYVIDADTVAALGDGSSKAGASVLDKFRQQIRQHKRSAPTNDIPPKAKSPMEYMKMARKGK